MTYVTISNNNNNNILIILDEYNFDITTNHNGNGKYINTAIHVEKCPNNGWHPTLERKSQCTAVVGIQQYSSVLAHTTSNKVILEFIDENKNKTSHILYFFIDLKIKIIIFRSILFDPRW